MNSFELAMPVNLIFGRGKIKLIGGKARELGLRALIVTGKSSARTGALAAVTTSLKKAGVGYVLFDQVTSNPLTTTVMEGAELAGKKKCDVVIGLGGGSPMDAAKAIAFMAVNPGHISDYVFRDKSGRESLPVIAVTTTAGTGSELDRYAVVTDPETHDKKSLKNPASYPKFSIVDPELMYSLPSPMVAATGFDAFSHALESLLSPKANPLSEMISLEAIRLISKHLPMVYKEPDSYDSWDLLAWGNSLGGWTIDITGVGPIHGLEHPISGLLDVTHGAGLAALTLPILKVTAEYSADKFKKAALAIEGPWKEAADLIPAVDSLLTSIDLKPGLTDLGVKDVHLPWLVDMTLSSSAFPLSNCHHPGLARDHLDKILSEAL